MHKKKCVFWLVFLGLTFLFALQNSFNYLNPDLGWHLKTGEQIYQSKSIPHINSFNYTLIGTRWVDHEWLSNLITYFVYIKFNYCLVSILFAFFIALVFFLIKKNLTFYTNKINWALFTFLTIFGLIAMHQYFGIRMQEITLIGLSILLWLINIFNHLKKQKQLLIYSLSMIYQIFSSELNYKNLSFNLNFKHKRWTKFIKFYLAVCLIMLPLTIVFNTKFTNNPFNSYCRNFPCQAVSYIKNNPELKNKKIFNYYSWGGYLIWTWPEKTIFIDGRLPQYKIAGSTMLEEYDKFFTNQGKKLLDQYNIELVLLPNKKENKPAWLEEKIFKLKESRADSPEKKLIDLLAASSNWDLVYSDNASLIFGRTN